MSTPDNSGITPLHIATYSGYLDMVKVLYEMGADLNVVGGPRKETVLIIAAANGFDLIVILNFVNYVGRCETTFPIAEVNGHFDI